MYSMGLCVLDTRVSRAKPAEQIEIALQVWTADWQGLGITVGVY